MTFAFWDRYNGSIMELTCLVTLWSVDSGEFLHEAVRGLHRARDCTLCTQSTRWHNAQFRTTDSNWTCKGNYAILCVVYEHLRLSDPGYCGSSPGRPGSPCRCRRPIYSPRDPSPSMSCCPGASGAKTHGHGPRTITIHLQTYTKTDPAANAVDPESNRIRDNAQR